MASATHPGSDPALERVDRWIVLLAALFVTGVPALSSAEQEVAGSIRDAGAQEQGDLLPRRPPLRRLDPRVSFPKTVLPETDPLPEREETGALDAFLGPVPKQVVLAEGTLLEAMQRVANLENTRLGFATVGGNTLTPEDVERLSGLPSVHLHLVAPLEAVHVEVAERVGSLRAATVYVPEDRLPEDSLPWRLARLGATRRNVVLEGALSRERLEALAGLSGQVTVNLPADGFEPALLELLSARTGGLSLIVPSDVSDAGLEGLAGLRIEALTLQTEGNRLRPEVLLSAVALESRIVVRLDGRVTRDDLRSLKGAPRLELLVWLADSPGVPAALIDLLKESEGRRPNPEGPMEEGSPSLR